MHFFHVRGEGRYDVFGYFSDGSIGFGEREASWREVWREVFPSTASYYQPQGDFEGVWKGVFPPKKRVMVPPSNPYLPQGPTQLSSVDRAVFDWSFSLWFPGGLLGGVLVMKLSTVLFIVFGFIVISIIRLSCKAFLIASSLSFGVIDLQWISFQLCLKIIIVDDRHKLLTLN